MEDCPAVYDEDGLFDTSIIPWWAWVRRFHLPEAEKINGGATLTPAHRQFAATAATESASSQNSDYDVTQLTDDHCHRESMFIK
jgi:hypothetical protein